MLAARNVTRFAAELLKGRNIDWPFTPADMQNDVCLGSIGRPQLVASRPRCNGIARAGCVRPLRPKVRVHPIVPLKMRLGTVSSRSVSLLEVK